MCSIGIDAKQTLALARKYQETTMQNSRFLQFSFGLTDWLDEVSGSVLTEVLGADVSELVLCLHVVDADCALLDQLLDGEVPQSHVLESREVGSVSGHVQSR